MEVDNTASTEWVLEQIVQRRREQDALWGGPDHDDEHDRSDWSQFICKQLVQAGREPDQFYQCMLDIAALAVAALESEERARLTPRSRFIRARVPQKYVLIETSPASAMTGGMPWTRS